MAFWIRLNCDWDDSDWVFALSSESQLAWVKMLCHCKRDGRGGVVKSLSPLVASRKWGVGEESVVKMLQAAVNDGALVSDGESWTITNWSGYQQPDTTGAQRQKRFRDKTCPKQEPSVTDSNGVTGVTLRCAVTRQQQEQEQEQEQKKLVKKRATFTKPTPEEARAYGKSIGLPSTDSDHFRNHFESNGWQVGRSPMKDWQAAMRTWKANAVKFSRGVQFDRRDPGPGPEPRFSGMRQIGEVKGVPVFGGLQEENNEN